MDDNLTNIIKDSRIDYPSILTMASQMVQPFLHSSQLCRINIYTMLCATAAATGCIYAQHVVRPLRINLVGLVTYRGGTPAQTHVTHLSMNQI